MGRMMMGRRAAFGAAAGLLTVPAFAQAPWPDKPVRILVAFPPGASTDVLARALANALTPALGQPVVVENRPGAGGNIATVAVRRSPPDGSVFLAHSVAYAVNPSLFRNAGYDALTDLEPVAMLASTPNIITVNPEKLQVGSLGELIAQARTRGLDYGSSGIGTTTHLGMELLFRSLARVEVQHVPFGPAQAVTAVVGGQVPIGSTSLPPALPMVREGRLRGIAVTSLRRDAALPDVPTVAEQGYPGFEALTWFGLMAPHGTPAAICDRMNAEINKALTAAETRGRLDAMGFAPDARSRADFASYLGQEVTKWAAVVRASGATAE
ncbi:tripartite tricarboxylate transporter substrate binding protein [Roseomonas stagni]|uniref:Tripartite tricarboxylate transporter substrate binding protein n=1 Tax=Falsiroseomonas algicola TaxID=2716930 RepID=A0A6M1LFW4_9PROT|nr:tripartite tricarboxylate transporter substrate binding protein [Falsiroseomonas algicola]NGM19091.1 tripartite tricarboxylate transporter substrate binding protein [Falsiroseomonas algicola]